MIILIIFFILASIIAALFLLKLRIKISFKIKNLNVKYTIVLLSKRINGELKIKERLNNEKNKIFNVREKIKKSDEKNKKYDVKSFLEKIEINELNLSMLVGLLYFTPTIISVIFISSIIPVLHKYFSNNLEGLKYKIYPAFNELKIMVNGDVALKITPINLIIFLIYQKRMNSFLLD